MSTDGDGYVTPMPPRPGGSSRLRWLGVIAGFAVLVGVVVLQRHSGNAPAAADPATTGTTSASTTPASTTPPPTRQSGTPPTRASPTSTSADTPTSTPTPTSPSTSGLATTIATLSSPLPASSAGWEIVGVGSQGYLRIDPSTGRVVQVPWPDTGLNGASYQSIVPGPGRLLVTGYDNGTLVIPDAGPAVKAPGLLSTTGTVLPGPDPAHLWVQGGSDSLDGMPPRTLVLVDWQGRAAGSSISIPDYALAYGLIQPDGSGYAMTTGIGGTYDVRPGSITLITHGTVLAAGPTGFLAYECGDTPHCRTVLVDRATGARRTLRDVPVGTAFTSYAGQIAADGTRAAYPEITTSSNSATATLMIVDLASGKASAVAASMFALGSSTSFAFSPDGRHLAMIIEGGDVGILDIATGAVHDLGATAASGSFLQLLTIRAR